jgi:hypothetical protein
MNLLQANALIREANRLFNRAANSWVRGNNSGNSATNRKCVSQCERFRNRAEALLIPLGRRRLSRPVPVLYRAWL